MTNNLNPNMTANTSNTSFSHADSELESIDVFVPDDSEIILASLLNEPEKKIELESFVLCKDIDI